MRWGNLQVTRAMASEEGTPSTESCAFNIAVSFFVLACHGKHGFPLRGTLLGHCTAPSRHWSTPASAPPKRTPHPTLLCRSHDRMQRFFQGTCRLGAAESSFHTVFNLQFLPLLQLFSPGRIPRNTCGHSSCLLCLSLCQIMARSGNAILYRGLSTYRVELQALFGVWGWGSWKHGMKSHSPVSGFHRDKARITPGKEASSGLRQRVLFMRRQPRQSNRECPASLALLASAM